MVEITFSDISEPLFDIRPFELYDSTLFNQIIDSARGTYLQSFTH